MNPIMMRAAILAVVTVWVASAGCSGADHDALAAQDASSAGGSGGSIVDAGGENADATAVDAADAAAAADAHPPDSSFVADGPSVFTMFNGIPNARAIRFCFEVEGTDGFAALSSAPLPDDVEGLAYGRGLSAKALAGADLETQSVRPVVLAGELELIDGVACDQLDPPPEGVWRSALQVIPSGTLSRGRSVLMVAAGCVGMPAPDAGDATQVCGEDALPPAANVRLLVASMERTPVDAAMGVQAFAASLASGAMTIEQMTAFPSMSTTIAMNLELGEIAPRPPLASLSVADLGTSPEDNSLRVAGVNAGEPAATIALTEALERGGLTLDDLGDGSNYTVVLYGPRPGTGDGAWFKGFSMTVLASDP